MSAVYPPHASFPLPGLSAGSPASPRSAPGAGTAARSWASALGEYGSAPPLPAGLRAGRAPGLLTVVLIHALVFWALASGLARDVVELVKTPIEMVIVPEVVPPPPPLPPKIEKIRDVPKTPPPPAYVPPPDITPLAPPPVPVIAAVQSAPPPIAPLVIEPPAPPAPARVEPARQEISVACPGYQAVIAEAMEAAFERVGIPGTVRTLLKVRGSQITDVAPQSGPKAYHKYLQAAIKRMHCSVGGDREVQVVLDVVFQP